MLSWQRFSLKLWAVQQLFSLGEYLVIFWASMIQKKFGKKNATTTERSTEQNILSANISLLLQHSVPRPRR